MRRTKLFMSIVDQLKLLQERLNAVFQMIKLLDEYYSQRDDLAKTKFAYYFEVMYSYINRYLVLELDRLDDNAPDCVSISSLKKEVAINFDTIFPKEQKNVYGLENCNITKDQMMERISTIFSKHINSIRSKVDIIRNKSGLAHGQPETFDVMLSMEEVKELAKAYASFLNMVDERLNNSNFAFGKGLIEEKGLSELVSSLTKSD